MAVCIYQGGSGDGVRYIVGVGLGPGVGVIGVGVVVGVMPPSPMNALPKRCYSCSETALAMKLNRVAR